MLKQNLISELLREGENTRKLLKAIPDSALDWRPSEKSWNTAQLASHIAGIYDWYSAVVNMAELNLDDYTYDRGDLSRAANIAAKFEENFANARKALEGLDEAKAMDEWSMTKGGHKVIPPTPRIGIIRYVLCNHIYHHRGQLVTYLRSAGYKVPGLYGPTADDIR